MICEYEIGMEDVTVAEPVSVTLVVWPLVFVDVLVIVLDTTVVDPLTVGD